eukprot:5582850-Amphidinium_carterae.1
MPTLTTFPHRTVQETGIGRGDAGDGCWRRLGFKYYQQPSARQIWGQLKIVCREDSKKEMCGDPEVADAPMLQAEQDWYAAAAEELLCGEDNNKEMWGGCWGSTWT